MVYVLTEETELRALTSSITNPGLENANVITVTL